jgi:hypothetical protein
MIGNMSFKHGDISGLHTSRELSQALEDSWQMNLSSRVGRMNVSPKSSQK